MKGFKTIQGFKDRYLANDKGIVISINGKTFKEGSMRFLKPQRLNNGYYVVNLVGPAGERKTTLVHNIVMELFGTPKPSPSHIVHFKDFNKRNANINNLEWMTRKEAMALTWQRNNTSNETNMGAHGRAILLLKDNKPYIVYDAIKTAATTNGISIYQVYKHIDSTKKLYDCNWVWLKEYEEEFGKVKGVTTINKQ